MGDSVDESAPTFLFTSESVGEGHPDKVCDQVSDAILDAHLRQDLFSQVSCQTAAKTGMILVCGDIISKAHINFQKVIRNTIKQIGYDKSAKGFDYKTCNVIQALDLHNPDDEDNGYEGEENEEKPARDLGLMFGYASDETEECMPLTIMLSHQLNAKIAELRRNGTLPWARPDTKTQITMEYRADHGPGVTAEYRADHGAMVPVRVHTVVISAQHDETVTLEQLRNDLMEHVVRPVIPAKYLDANTVFHMQPSGRFIIGGPQGDAGLTGRKIIVDTYGGWGAHGGGALSGKDPAQIDRCASYAARWVAKSLVKAGLCRRVLVQLAYSMGVVEPLSVMIYTYGTSKKTHEEILSIVKNNFDLRPGKIVSELNLRQPIYQKTAAYGHFGRPEFPWEQPKTLKV